MLLSLWWSAVGLYVLLCVALFALQSRMLYLPQFTRVSAADTNFVLEREGLVLRGWRVNPGKPAALLYFGGNAESIEMQGEHFARWFPDRTIYLLAYRGYGASDGSPSERALKADALALFDHVRAQHADVGVLARSVGSGIGVHLAASRDVSRLGLITPYDSLRAVASAHYPWFPVRWLLREPFDSMPQAAQLRVPTLLLVARFDEVIAPAHAEALAAAFTHEPKMVYLDTDHNGVEQDGRFELALVKFFAVK